MKASAFLTCELSFHFFAFIPEILKPQNVRMSPNKDGNFSQHSTTKRRKLGSVMTYIPTLSGCWGRGHTTYYHLLARYMCYRGAACNVAVQHPQLKVTQIQSGPQGCERISRSWSTRPKFREFCNRFIRKIRTTPTLSFIGCDRVEQHVFLLKSLRSLGATCPQYFATAIKMGHQACYCGSVLINFIEHIG